MREYEDEVRSPTGLERLAGLLAATKENAAAEISKLTSQVQALEIERRALEDTLESCRDDLGDAESLVQQLRLENTRKWRVEERDDWRALLDSMQADRTALQHQNDKLEAEVVRCITALLSIFPSSSRSLGGDGEAAADGAAVGVGVGVGVGVATRGKDAVGGGKAGGSSPGGADNHLEEHPPELTQRSCRSVCSRAIAAVDLEWLSSLAREHNVTLADEVGGQSDGDGVDGNPAVWGTKINADAQAGATQSIGQGAASLNGGGDPASECLRLRVELDALKHESNTTRVTLESQVFEQQQELRRLRLEVSRSTELRGGGGGGGGGDGAERGGVSLAGVFRWWRQDRTTAVGDGRKGAGGGGKGPVSGAITVV